ncbi:hypothetical protein ACFY5A_02305 [Microbacterium sp. NPDC012755]|uniref:hypothetical protein n=1 Tax=Microbacterium sp. NPDC012755 TaxID=3364184 RepID=UPI0036CA4768
MTPLFTLVALAVAAAVIAVIGVFLWQLGRGALGDGAQTFRIVFRGAWAAAAVIVLVAVITMIVDLASPAITMTVPLQNVWPRPLPGVSITPPAAQVQAAGITLADLTVTGVSWPARIIWTIGQGLSILLPAAAAALIALAARHLLNGVPFSPVLTRTVRLAAFTVLIVGSVAPVLRGIAGSMTSYEALQIGSASWTGYPDDWAPSDALPQPTIHIPFEFWPLGVGIALLLVAAILQFGTRLGAEKDLLQKDTEGLV